MPAEPQLPWRGPGTDHPALPLPPDPMPLRAHGQTRKRWRYVGVFGPETMLCAARAQVGPLSQSFWCCGTGASAGASPTRASAPAAAR